MSDTIEPTEAEVSVLAELFSTTRRQSNLAILRAHVAAEVAKATGGKFPSDNKETLVEVFSQTGDPVFVCGLNGKTNGDMIEQIEKDLNDNRDFMEKGDGRYLYRAAYESAQIGDEGRIELQGYWDLSLVAFLPNIQG